MQIKNIIIVAFTFLCINDITAQWMLGGGVRYNTNNLVNALGVNAKFAKGISDRLDLNIDGAYYFSKTMSWSVEGDVQWQLLNINDRLILSPLAGLNFTKFSAINNSIYAGASLKFGNDRVLYYLEPKWIFNFNQLVFSAGATRLF